jgi:hypothetical protein
MSFEESLTQLVTDVFGPILPEHGIPEPEITAAERRLGLQFPRVLRHYYHRLGRHNQVSDGMNHLLRPDVLYVVNDALVFEEENQKYYYSGISLQKLACDDPPVSQGNHGENVLYPESNRLSDYLLALICWQAANVCDACDQIPLTALQLTRMKAQLPWAAFGLDEANDTLGLWGGGVAVAAFTNSMDAYLSARTEQHLRDFQSRFGL